MKIIFDDEKEKQEFIRYICPSVLSRKLKDNEAEDCEDCKNGNCLECWGKLWIGDGGKKCR